MRYRSRSTTNSTFCVGTNWAMNIVTGVKSGPTQYMSSYVPNNPARVETCWDEVHKPPFHEGGPLNKWLYVNDGWKVCGHVTNLRSQNQNPSTCNSYTGGFICGFAVPPEYFPVQAAYTLGKKTDGRTLADGGYLAWGDGSSLGATAWKKYRPGKSVADASVFLGEIRDVPRMLQQTAKFFRNGFVGRFGRNPKEKSKVAANAWLNTQFGWLPFLNDLRRFYKAYRTSDTVIQQLRRDNGQWVKRGGTVKTEEAVEVLGSSSAFHKSYPSLNSLFYPGYIPSLGSWLSERKQVKTTWFEARFKYYIPNIESVAWEDKALREIYGLTPNPALIWELTPWSWLVDWCSNVGDVFNNLDTGLAQNLTAKYAYLMTKTDCEIDVQSFPRFFGAGQQVHSWRFSLGRKQRVQANPFGFSLTWDMLSPRQWSILSALGITRLH